MIPFCKPSITWRERLAVDRVLRTPILTTGKVTKEFEERFAEYVGAKHAVAVSSCTIGLELAVRYHKVKIALVPSFTFCATAQAVQNSGGQILFADIDPVSLCIDPGSEIVHSAMKIVDTVIPVHLGGNLAFTAYPKTVIEDSAHRIERNQCQNSPNTVVFSFYPTKNMTTGEGGMICTNDTKEYEWYLKARSHGRNKLMGSGYDVEFLGLKANLPDILSAIGLEQLKRLPKMTDKRNALVRQYNLALNKSWKGNHLYPLFVNGREKFIKYMADNGVQCSTHFSPLHLMTAYKKFSKFKLPYTETLGKMQVSLPLFPDLKRRQVNKICELIKNYEV